MHAPVHQEVVVPKWKSAKKVSRKKSAIPNFTTSYDNKYFTYEKASNFENASRKNQKSTTSDKEVQNPIQQTDNTEQKGSDNTCKEFNLREAVIYSEILKPKFDEQ